MQRRSYDIAPVQPDLLADLPARIHMIPEEGAKAGRSRPAFTDERGAVWSYDRLIDTIEQVSHELAAVGVRSGDRVLIACENSIAAIVLMYAVSRLDAWSVMVNARQSQRELELIASDCRPRVTLYTHVVSADADAHACRQGAHVQRFSGIGDVKMTSPDEQVQPEDVYADPARQVAVLIYTTGTTGKPKGVMLSHRNLTFVAARGKRTRTLLADDVGLCLMPISHSYGLVTMQGLLFAGGHLRIVPRFSLPTTIEAIRGGELTLFIAVPALLARLVAHVDQAGIVMTPNRLRYAYTGTAPLDLSLRRDVERVLGVVLQNGYGLTETSPTISRSNYCKGSDEINIGPPIPGVEVRIVDQNGDAVPDDVPGELHVRGPNVMLGYYRQPELTRAIIDADGFLNTGDIVSRTSRGELVIQGRSKELIIRSGFNVYPGEVEAVLNAHHAVLASAVVGRAVEGDEEIVAFVEVAPERAVDVDDLFALADTQLARYKKPQHIVVLPSLPMAPNGKVLKSELKKYAESLGRDDGKRRP